MTAKLLVEIERFLRWLRDMTPDQRRKHDTEIGEMSTALVDQLETINDEIERDSPLESDDDTLGN